MSYAKNATSNEVEVVDRNDYYPFGLNFHEGAEFSVTGSSLNYKFQEQELQETGFYSFKWRQYMPDVGRFFNVDPLSEKYAYQSHYNFSENRVINAREIEGLEAEDINEDRMMDPFEEGPSPLIREAEFDPYDPSTYRTGSDEPLITPESISEKITEIEEVFLTKESKEESDDDRSWLEMIWDYIAGNDDARDNTMDEAIQDKTPYAPDEPLRRNNNGEPKVDDEAKGREHTQLGTKEGRGGDYTQGREFDKDGKPLKDIDHTDHGRPGEHTNPHEHLYEENRTGGTLQRGNAKPLDY